MLKNKSYLLLLSILSLVVFGVLSYSYYIGNRMAKTFTPLIDAAMEIKLETTTAHLWFEEILSGDRHEDIEVVWKHIEQADWYAKAMLEGGKNQEGIFIALKDPYLSSEIIEVREKIQEFKIITAERFAIMEDAMAGTEIDEQYDTVFRDFILQADEVETRLQQIMAEQQLKYRIIQLGLVVLLFTTILIIGLIISRFEKRRLQDYKSIIEINSQLKTEIAERKHTQEELSKAFDIIHKVHLVIFLWKNEETWPVEFVSENVNKLTGYTSSDFIEKRITYADIIHKDDKNNVIKEVLRYSKEEGTQSFEHEPYRLVTKSGNIIWIDDKTNIRRDSLGNITHYEGIVYDITNRKRIEDELKKYQHQLEELVQERTTELEEKNRSLENMNELFVGREYRIKELRDNLNELEKK